MAAGADMAAISMHIGWEPDPEFPPAYRPGDVHRLCETDYQTWPRPPALLQLLLSSLDISKNLAHRKRRFGKVTELAGYARMINKIGGCPYSRELVNGDSIF